MVGKSNIHAGQDTTASAITWMVKYLDDNQHALHTLRVRKPEDEVNLYGFIHLYLAVVV